MPPEVIDEILAKLELTGPLKPKDFLQAVLDNQETSIGLSLDVKKAILQVQRNIDKINKDILASSKTPPPPPPPPPPPKTPETKSIDDFLKILGLSLSSKKDSSIEPTLYKTGKDELELTESSIKKFAKAASLSNEETNSLLKKLKKSVDDENDSLGLLDSFLKKKSGGFLDTLIDFGKLLLIGGLSTLLLSSFGPALTGIIDRIFGTNLTGLFAPFRESLAKWQGYIDMFGKYTAELGIVLLNGASGLKKLLVSGIFGGKLSKAAAEAAGVVKPSLFQRLGFAAGVIKKAEPVAELPAMTRDASGILRYAKGVKDAAGNAIGGRFVTKELEAAFEAAEKIASKGFIGRTVGNLVKGIGDVAKIGGGIIGKVGGKLLRRIPFIGSLISFGLAAKKLFDGDVVGGLFDIASALAGFIPIVGIPLSFAIDFLSAKVTEQAGGDKTKKGAVVGNFLGKIMDWVLYPIKKYFKNIIDIGDAFNKGDWLRFFKDIAYLVPGFGFIVDLVTGTVENTLSEAKKSGQPLTIGSFFQNLVKGFITKFISMLPETFGIRAQAAKLFGMDIAAPPEQPIPSPPPPPPTPPGLEVLKKGQKIGADIATPDYLKQHPGLKWVEDSTNPYGGHFESTEDETLQKQIAQKFTLPGVNVNKKPDSLGQDFKNIFQDIKKADLFNPVPANDVTLPKNYNPLVHHDDNEPWDTEEAPWAQQAMKKGSSPFTGAPTEQLHPELKGYFQNFGNIMSDFTMSFKDFQNAMLATAGGSVVSINQSSVTDSGSEGFFMGTRDPIFETRWMLKNK